MIVKVLDDSMQDKFLVEAAYIRWDHTHGDNYIVLEVHAITPRLRKAANVSVSDSKIEEEPSLRLRIYHGDRVFIMNDQGKTIDSKRIQIGDNQE